MFRNNASDKPEDTEIQVVLWIFVVVNVQQPV